MKKILKKLINRGSVIILLLLIQLIYLMSLIWNLGEVYSATYWVFALLSYVCVFAILNRSKENLNFKLAWIIPILIFPLFGGAIYLIFGGTTSAKRIQKKMNIYHQRGSAYLEQDKSIYNEIYEEDKGIARECKFLKRVAGYPVYKNTSTEYFPIGEKKYERMLEELKKAKHYIFLEYFIIEEGKMWNSILDVLEEKVEAGVDVRVIYDDIGSLYTLPRNYYEILERKGIKTCVFNPFVPVLSIRLNNRDHRKILVIDGHTAFNGGINLADEYINEKVRFGHWKDSAVMIKGEAVWSYTVMFLSMWDYLTKSHDNYDRFRPSVHAVEEFKSDGYVIPYSDSPLDNEPVGKLVYLGIIKRATDYIYITTPYLICDDEMMTALTLAAKSGVDVRIITPHIPDKFYVHAVTRACYEDLIEAGVKIYEYTPGFIHAKNFVSDDKVGVVGTINLDFRSLYLHFECATWFYKSSCISYIKEDFLRTVEKSEKITLEKCNDVTVFTRILRSFLRLFSPLM